MPSEQTDQALPVTLSLTIELDDGAGAVSGADDAVDRVILIIQSRLEEFGVRRSVLERVGRNRIVATLPRVRDAGRLREIITTRGFLEFRITDMQREFEGALDRIDRALARAGVAVGERSASKVAPQTAIQQLLGAATDTTIQSGESAAGADAVDVATERPSETIFSGFLNTGQLPGEVFVVEEDVPQVTRLMEHPEFQRNVPRGIDLLWGRELMSLGGRSYRGLYAVESRPIITGEQLSDAQVQLDPITNQAVVNFQLTRAGGRIFGRETAEHVNDFMAIVLDGRVQGQPPVIRSEIGRRGQIELGSASIQDAQDLALILRMGALPAPIRVVEERVVDGALSETRADDRAFWEAFPLAGRSLQVGDDVQGELVPYDDDTQNYLFYDDPIDTLYAQAWALEGRQGDPTVTVDLLSTVFDPYLIVVGPGLANPLEDDDGAGRCNARLSLVFPQDGVYRVIATTTQVRRGGAFRFRVSNLPGRRTPGVCVPPR